MLTDAASSVLGGAANGTPQTAGTFYNELIDTILQPTLFNDTPNAWLWSPVMAKWYAKVYDTTNQPLREPEVVTRVPRFVTAQIPASFTQGTATTSMSDVFAGDFTQLIIGQRLASPCRRWSSATPSLDRSALSRTGGVTSASLGRVLSRCTGTSRATDAHSSVFRLSPRITRPGNLKVTRRKP